MIYLSVILGGIWRRLLGGLCSLRRSLVFCMLPVTCIPVWLQHGPKTFIVVSILLAIYWSFGHEWTSLPKLILRYFLPAAYLGLAASVAGLCGWPLGFCGLTVACEYYTFYKAGDIFPKFGEFFNGYTTYAEFVAGCVILLGVCLL